MNKMARTTITHSWRKTASNSTITNRRDEKLRPARGICGKNSTTTTAVLRQGDYTYPFHPRLFRGALNITVTNCLRHGGVLSAILSAAARKTNCGAVCHRKMTDFGPVLYQQRHILVFLSYRYRTCCGMDYSILLGVRVGAGGSRRYLCPYPRPDGGGVPALHATCLREMYT